MPKRRTVDEESEVGGPEERPAAKFQFTAASLYNSVNQYRSALQYKFNKNADVIDRIEMWVDQAALEGRIEILLEFPYRFSTDSPMHEMLVSRMRACMPSGFMHEAEPAYGHRSTGWCIAPADADDEVSSLRVWWNEPAKLVREPTQATGPQEVTGE